MKTAEQISKEFLEPFPVEKVKFKPQTKVSTKGYALVSPYIDARDLYDRLDEVVGTGKWQTKHEVISTGEKHMVVECSLGVKVEQDNGESEWIWKSDVGEGSPPEVAKSAYSDSIKRAGVAFGVGRYLYSCETVFAKYKNEGAGGKDRWVLDEKPEAVKARLFPEIYGNKKQGQVKAKEKAKAKEKTTIEQAVVNITNSYLQKYFTEESKSSDAGCLIHSVDILFKETEPNKWINNFKVFHDNDYNRKIIHKPEAKTLQRLGSVTKQMKDLHGAEGTADIQSALTEKLNSQIEVICLHPFLDNDSAYTRLCEILEIEPLPQEEGNEGE